MFFFKIRQEKVLWIAQCKRLESFDKLMSKNSISVLWWRLVRACCVLYSLLWQGLLNRELLSTPAAGIYRYWTVCIPTCVKTSQLSCQVSTLVNPHAVSLSGCECVGWRGEMQAHTDRQADLCMIFRLTCAWFFRLTYAWFSGRLTLDFFDLLMHDFQADCMIFPADLCMIFRLTCAWFSGWLMHDFPADLCLIFRLTYALFSDWLMQDFQDDLCMIFRLTYAWFSTPFRLSTKHQMERTESRTC